MERTWNALFRPIGERYGLCGRASSVGCWILDIGYQISEIRYQIVELLGRFGVNERVSSSAITFALFWGWAKAQSSESRP
jgi:hypothetical protein